MKDSGPDAWPPRLALDLPAERGIVDYVIGGVLLGILAGLVWIIFSGPAAAAATEGVAVSFNLVDMLQSLALLVIVLAGVGFGVWKLLTREKRGTAAGATQSRWKRDLRSLHWETIAVLAGVIVVVLAAGYAVGAHEGAAYAEGKGAHLGEVLAFGLTGAFVAFVIGWIVNRCRLIRERAAPAADDSIKSIEAWRKQREADDRASKEWTQADATMTLAACLRFVGSYFGFIALAAAGMLMAG